MQDTPAPQPRLRRSVLVAVPVLLAGIVFLLLRLPSLLTIPNLLPPLEELVPPKTAELPDAYTKPLARYGELEPRLPQSSGTPQASAPVVAALTATPVQRPMAAPGVTPQVPAALEQWNSVPTAILVDDGRATVHPQAQPVTHPQGQVQAITQTKAPARWGIALDHGQQHRRQPTQREQEDMARKGEASKLISPARWAIPAYPLRTIYRSMQMAAVLLDDINTDIPASTIRAKLTIPLYNKFGRDDIILDKDTIVILAQQGKAEFGQKRIQVKLQQLEPPSGEVVDLKAYGGDAQGAAGIPGKVNAHIPELLLAAGINALLNIGLSTAVGTPGRGQYYQNPTQQAAQEAAQSVAQDVNGLVRQQLKVPPTIYAKAGTFVTISPEENITFSRPPQVVR